MTHAGFRFDSPAHWKLWSWHGISCAAQQSWHQTNICSQILLQARASPYASQLFGTSCFLLLFTVMPQPGRFLCLGDSSISAMWCLFYPTPFSQRAEEQAWEKLKTRTCRTCYPGSRCTLSSEGWSSSSCKMLFSWLSVFFRVLTAPPFPGRGHGRDTQMSPRALDFAWEALAGASSTQTLQITLFLYDVHIENAEVMSLQPYLCSFPRLSTCPAKAGESSGAVWAVTSSQVISLLIQKMQLRVTQTNSD